MEAKQPQFAIRLLPSLTDFAFLMPLFFLFGRMEGVKTLLSDCDTGWHIRTGQWILANHAVPTHDIFSFSKPGGVWYAWEWLSDVFFAWLFTRGGLAAVVLFAILAVCFTFTLLYKLVRRHANPIIAVVVTMVAAAGSSIHWLARPHLFTFLFLVVFYYALENVRSGRTRLAGVPYLAILPILTIPWTNLHGGFFVGIVMIGAYGTGELLRAAFSAEPDSWSAAWRNAAPYFLSAVACLAASLINPYFYHLHVHMVKYISDPYNSQHIMEFLSPSFHHPTAIFFECMLVLAVATSIWNVAKGRYAEPILLMIWAHAGLLAARNIPLFMIVAAPMIAAALQEGLERLPKLPAAQWLRTAASKFYGLGEETGQTESIGRWHLVSVAAVVLVAAILYAPHPPKSFRSEFDPKSYPAGAIEVLRSDSTAKIFTHDEWGDYLIWRLYPGHKVFVDGRSDFYGDDFGNKYIDVLNVKYDWEKTLTGYGVDTILMPPSAALTGALKESSRWRVVYDDGIAVVFRSVHKTAGEPISAAARAVGESRGREATKTGVGDRAIANGKPKT